MRILVIDDSKTYVDECCGLLEDQNYLTSKAYSVKEAEELLSKESNDINIALIDMYMQNDPKAGLKLVKLIQNNYHQIVPIVVTGNVNLDDAAECMEEGAFFYIIKDQTPAKLLFQIIKIAESRYRTIVSTKKLPDSLNELLKFFEIVNATNHSFSEVIKRIREEVLQLAVLGELPNSQDRKVPK